MAEQSMGLRQLRTEYFKKRVYDGNGNTTEVRMPREVQGLTIVEMATLVYGSESGRSKYWNCEIGKRAMSPEAKERVQHLVQQQIAQGFVLTVDKTKHSVSNGNGTTSSEASGAS